MNEKIPRNNIFQQEDSNRKRSHQPETLDDQEEVTFQDIARSILEETPQSTAGHKKRAKVQRVNPLEQPITLMNGLESPAGNPWYNQAEPGLEEPMNPNLNAGIAFFSPKEGMPEPQYETSPIRPNGRGNPSWQGPPHSGRPPYADPYATSWHQGPVQPVYESRGPYSALLGQSDPSRAATHRQAAVAPNYYPHHPYANGGSSHSAFPPYENPNDLHYPMQPGNHSEPPIYTNQNPQLYPSYEYQDPSHAGTSTYQPDVATHTVSRDSNLSERASRDSPQGDTSPVVGPSRITGPVLMFVPEDDDMLSDYQIFLRKNIQFFAADNAEVTTPAPGRKKPVKYGQVGMRCIHCADTRIQHRTSATVYFPSRLRGLYQAAQNIGLTHFRSSCPNMPEDLKTRAKSFQAHGKRATAGHGGKKYWADTAANMGIVETEDGLRFRGN